MNGYYTEHTSYKVRILDCNHIFDDTLKVYTEAVKYLIAVVINEWDILKDESPQMVIRVLEPLIHKTKEHPNPRYGFDKRFYKMPAYIRRAAIEDAFGCVSSYKSNLENWNKADPKQRGKKPRSPKIRVKFPTLYNGNAFLQTGEYSAKIKVFIRNTWDWYEINLRKSDIDYLKNHCDSETKGCPTLEKNGKRWSLRFPYKHKIKLNKTPEAEELVLGVDLGINNACVCTAMKQDGTIQDRRFLRLKRETDSLWHHIGLIKKAQQHGSRNPKKYWAFANNINTDITRKTAKFIVDTAVSLGCSTIVMEHLDLKGKKRGSKKQRLHLWKVREVQKLVTGKAHRNGIRISTVTARNTSKLAFDGTGEVERDEKNYSQCTFSTGKHYHTDLIASYNIAARYFIRAICKSVSEDVRLSISANVPKCDKRSTCTLSDLRDLYTYVHGVSLIGV